MLLLLWAIFSFTFTYSFSNVLTLCRFKGFDLCSFSSKELLLTFFCKAGLLATNSLNFCLSQKVFISPSLWWRSYFAGYRTLSYCCVKYFFCLLFSFFSFLYSHYVYMTPLVAIPQFLDIPFCYRFLFIFFCLCSLCLSVWEVSIETSVSSETVSSAMLNLLMSL